MSSLIRCLEQSLPEFVERHEVWTMGPLMDDVSFLDHRVSAAHTTSFWSAAVLNLRGVTLDSVIK